MDHFFARLEARANDVDSLLCIGLDPHPGLLPEYSPAAARDFCQRIVNACAPYACAFKPNSAFFEALGADGIAALTDVIATIPDDIPVILDAKRGDIASTSEAYAKAIFDSLGAHAVTVNPYLGADSIAPFLQRPECGVFVLCKTSNPGADDLQSLFVGNEPMYVQVARQAQSWSKHDNLGLVVGATDPHALAQVRAAAPDLWLLSPGVGAQSGNLQSALQAGVREDQLGMLINISRLIATSRNPEGAASELRDAINSERASSIHAPQYDDRARLAAILVDSGCVRFGEFTLKSGQQSPFYIDLRRLASFPHALQAVARSFQRMLSRLTFDCIAAIPYAALPIGTAVSLATGYPLIYPRRDRKQYGTRAAVDGAYHKGDIAVVLDDLVTTGESKFETIETLQACGLEVRDIAVLIDREQGAAATLTASDYRLHAVVTIGELLTAWRDSGAIHAAQHAIVSDYLSQGS